jgi:undecaprenyl-diphosphatase
MNPPDSPTPRFAAGQANDESLPLSNEEKAPALPLLSLTGAVLGLALFGWIAESVTHDQTLRFDASIRQSVHSCADPAVTRVMLALSFLGREGIIAGSVAGLLVFWRKRWKRAALWLTFTMLGSLFLEVTLKLVFHRPRPAPFFGSLPHGYSFPSGHALSSFCYYGIMAGLLATRLHSGCWRILLWLVAAMLVAGIGLSRIYLGVHYASDVLAGYLAAAVWVSTMLARDRLRVRLAKRSGKSIAGACSPPIQN